MGVRRSWVFNQNYTTNGVRRFDDPEWGYGADCPSGVMIGYIQSMDLDQVQEEVNTFGEQEAYSRIEREGSWEPESATTLHQRLNRGTPPPLFGKIRTGIIIQRDSEVGAKVRITDGSMVRIPEAKSATMRANA